MLKEGDEVGNFPGCPLKHCCFSSEEAISREVQSDDADKKPRVENPSSSVSAKIYGAVTTFGIEPVADDNKVSHNDQGT
jgi:hypothetical protein